jgi:hypothetical protein
MRFLGATHRAQRKARIYPILFANSVGNLMEIDTQSSVHRVSYQIKYVTCPSYLSLISQLPFSIAVVRPVFSEYAISS